MNFCAAPIEAAEHEVPERFNYRLVTKVYLDHGHTVLICDDFKVIILVRCCLPHHVVEVPRKPDKVRAVFDCAAVNQENSSKNTFAGESEFRSQSN